MPDDCVLIFAKAPHPGRVKTRLIPAIGERAATELYTGLLRRALDWVVGGTTYDVELWITPDESHPVLQALAREYRLPLCSQQGADLGERMAHATGEALQRYRRVVLIGVDCPPLNAEHLHQAFAWLAGGSDAVLGPAEDGGYVLIGLGRWDRRVFQGQVWGGAEVAETTRRRLREAGMSWRELPLLWDLDLPEDLPRYQRLIGGAV